jgi:hypothetical protein
VLCPAHKSVAVEPKCFAGGLENRGRWIALPIVQEGVAVSILENNCLGDFGRIASN